MKNKLIVLGVFCVALFSLTACAKETDYYTSATSATEGSEASLPIGDLETVPDDPVDDVGGISDCVDSIPSSDDTSGNIPPEEVLQELEIPDSSTVVGDDTGIVPDPKLPGAESPHMETPDGTSSEDGHSHTTKETPSTTEETSEMLLSQEYQLIVAGVSLPQGKYMEFIGTAPRRYALIPLTAVIKELGADVEWMSDTVARIRWNDKMYTLNTLEVSLLEDGRDLNLIIPTPGGRVHSQAIGCELLLDDVSVKTVALMLGTTIKVNVDYLNQIVVIDYP